MKDKLYFLIIAILFWVTMGFLAFLAVVPSEHAQWFYGE